MDRHTFELTISREIQQLLDELLPYHTPTAMISRQDLQQRLQAIGGRIEEAARDYYLESLCTADDLAEELGVSVEHMCALARQRFYDHGIGRQFGDTWVWTPDEVEMLRPQGE